MIEKSRAKMPKRALELHPDHQACPVRTWPLLDRLTTSWLLALPENGMSSPVFQEAISAHLGVPGPACKDWVVGEMVNRNSVVDLYGDKVMAAKNIPGDTWRERHDKVETATPQLCACCHRGGGVPGGT